jgi:uncharacterized SAM-binding protein YcdF (DUF218 family)
MQSFRKVGITFLKACALILIIICIGAVLDFTAIYGMGKIHHEVNSADAIIVLGAAHQQIATQRALKGLELYQEGKSAIMVLSGGKTAYPVSEAEYMKSVIMQHVYASDTPDMTLEENSLNTYENFLYSKREIPDAQSIIIVTDQFHIARSVLIAKSLGFQKVYWDSPDPSYLPISTRMRYYLSEMIAVPEYALSIIHL